MIDITPWKQYIRNLDEALHTMNEKTTLAVGVVPFSRVTTALFLKNHIVYCVKDCKDVPLMRQFAKVFCLEEHDPKLAEKVNNTGYLLRNYQFKAFLRSLQKPCRLFFYNVTPFIYETLQKEKYDFIGNDPKAAESVKCKADFRATLKKINLPHLPDKVVSREEFLQATFESYKDFFGGSYVCQRGDYDAGGEIATYFVHTPEDFAKTKKVFADDTRFTTVQISKFIRGDTVSMVACATRYGTLTGPLQQQLIDIPESLGNVTGRGVFVGHDWSLRPWGDFAEQESERILTTLGDYLYTQGYRGIFGVDLIVDSETKTVYPLECNPRYTGSFPLVSLLMLQHNLPPLDFFHLAEHLNIPLTFDLATMNRALKFRSTYSHILLTVKGVTRMPIDLPAGVWHLNAKDEICFVRPGLFPADLKAPNEFLVVDPVLKKGSNIGQNVFKLFKLIFPVGIAQNSYALKPEFSRIVRSFYNLVHTAAGVDGITARVPGEVPNNEDI